MSDFRLPITCDQFEARVSDYIDDLLSVTDRAIMDEHVSHCARCAVVLAEVAAIVREAAVMPLLAPSRDLWAGIAERLDTPVVSIATAQAAKVRRPMSFRLMAAAAALLMAASSGATYWFTRGAAPVGTQVASNASLPSTVGAPRVDSAPAANVVSPNRAATAGTDAPEIGNRNSTTPNSAVGIGERPRTRYASNDRNSVEFVYEREITAMRRIVDDRLGDLDSTTVVEIERNLRIIDKAINDSRRALQNDPRSRFLSSQLDRALENKLDVLRRIALL